jgi:hypothetical protein
MALHVAGHISGYHILIIIADGQVHNPKETACTDGLFVFPLTFSYFSIIHVSFWSVAIVEASKVSLSIITIGVGDGNIFTICVILISFIKLSREIYIELD